MTDLSSIGHKDCILGGKNMEYTLEEKDVLAMMQRKDFKGISKNDVISIASRFVGIRPEVAKEILVQFPEFVGLMKSVLAEYKGMLDTIVSSDDASIKEYYGVANKEMEQAAESRKLFYDLVMQVRADCSKLLDNPNLQPEMLMEIMNREVELVKMANEKDTEIRQQEREIEEKSNKKDSEKREFNWKLVGGISVALVTIAGISASVLGGKFDFKLPKK